MDKDIRVLRDLAKQYVDRANKPVQEERRKLWYCPSFSLTDIIPPARRTRV
jgi:hypothetical protein